MYRGFNLNFSFSQKTIDKWYNIGLQLNNQNKNRIHRAIEPFLLDDGSIDGTMMQGNWFPQIDSHVFISHSHNDENTAITLAGILHDSFGINSFIDSCIWGYASDLLWLIDSRYCLNDGGETFSYQKRNRSTSHIHTMLSMALTMMISRSECLFFINTPNSLSAEDVINKTESPWIYLELGMTKLIKIQIPERRFLSESRAFSKADHFDEDLRVKYEVDLSHLEELSFEELKSWATQHYKTPETALDGLYELKPPSNRNYIHG